MYNFMHKFGHKNGTQKFVINEVPASNRKSHDTRLKALFSLLT